MNAARALVGGAVVGAGMDLLIDWPRTRQQDHDDARAEVRYAAVPLALAAGTAAIRPIPRDVPLVLLAAGGVFLGEAAGNVVQDRAFPRFSHRPGESNGARDVAGRSLGLGLIGIGAAAGVAALPHAPGFVPRVLGAVGVGGVVVAAGAACVS